jgi:hypothetical protein
MQSFAYLGETFGSGDSAVAHSVVNKQSKDLHTVHIDTEDCALLFER